MRPIRVGVDAASRLVHPWALPVAPGSGTYPISPVARVVAIRLADVVVHDALKPRCDIAVLLYRPCRWRRVPATPLGRGRGGRRSWGSAINGRLKLSDGGMPCGMPSGVVGET